MEILLVRHANPDYAHDSLTPKGVDEARKLAEGLADVRLDEIYVSSLHLHPTGVTRLEMFEEDGFAHLKALTINDLCHLGPTVSAPSIQRVREAEV